MDKISVKDRLPSVAGRVYKTNIGSILFKGDGEWYGYDNVRVYPKWWEELRAEETMGNKIYITVDVNKRLPSIEKYYFTSQGMVYFDKDKKSFDPTKNLIRYWLEEIKTPDDPKELANVILTNAIVNLDKEHTQSLVRELCDRFGLLPTKEEIESAAEEDEDLVGVYKYDAYIVGANFVINHINGR